MHINSQVAVAVNKALHEAGIRIPFPQRDLHVKTVDPAARGALGGSEPARPAEPQERTDEGPRDVKRSTGTRNPHA